MTTPMKLARKKLIGFFRYELFPLGMLLIDMRHIQVLIGHAKAWGAVSCIPGSDAILDAPFSGLVREDRVCCARKAL